MEDLEYYTRALVNAIQNSDSYREYQHISNLLDKDQELKKSVNEYRKRVFMLQNSGDDDIDIYEKMDNVAKETVEFRKNPLVDKYLAYELRVCRMLQKINLDIVQSVDLDIKEIADVI